MELRLCASVQGERPALPRHPQCIAHLDAQLTEQHVQCGTCRHTNAAMQVRVSAQHARRCGAHEIARAGSRQPVASCSITPGPVSANTHRKARHRTLTRSPRNSTCRARRPCPSRLVTASSSHSGFSSSAAGQGCSGMASTTRRHTARASAGSLKVARMTPPVASTCVW